MENISLELAEDGILLLKIRANASKTRIKGKMADGSYKIDIAAVPEDNKANLALIDLLAHECGVPKSQIVILSGHTSPKKIIRIQKNPA